MTRWLSLRFWSQQGRTPGGSYAASALMHVAAMAMLATLWTTRPASPSLSQGVDSRLAVDDARIETPVLTSNPIAPTPSEGKAGGRPIGLAVAQQLLASPTRPLQIGSFEEATLFDAGSIVPGGVAWNEKVGVSSGAGGLGGKGTGNGTGDGDGDGGGFFGINVPTRSVVFVVDASGSMNHPHDSFAKTRFRRLKFELAKCISAMDSDTQFYIIFFNEAPIAMPAPSMVFATPAAKQRYLEWMASSKAIGETDPRAALAIAMKMSPHAIYFLTDGSFAKKHEKEILALPRTRTVIHTFAFGEEAAKDMLKQLAQKHEGQFLFVP